MRRFGGKKTNSRSGYEEEIKKNLDGRGLTYGYETIKMQYIQHVCKHCGEVAVTGSYTPDFILDPALPSVVESKGRLTAADRAKMLAVKRGSPTACIRLIFQRNDRIKAGVEFRYGDWADKHGFEWAIGDHIPDRWFVCADPILCPGYGKKKSRKKKGDEGQLDLMKQEHPDHLFRLSRTSLNALKPKPIKKARKKKS